MFCRLSATVLAATSASAHDFKVGALDNLPSVVATYRQWRHVADGWTGRSGYVARETWFASRRLAAWQVLSAPPFQEEYRAILGTFVDWAQNEHCRSKYSIQSSNFDPHSYG
jgi:hypothetical protein